MDGELVILGNLDGFYFTHQENLLAFGNEHLLRESKPGDHTINLYRGTISDTEILPEFKPQEYENYKSITLIGGPPLLVRKSKSASLADDQKLEFSSLILIDPIIVNYWFNSRDKVGESIDPNEENSATEKKGKNKVYVHVRSKVIGRTAKKVESTQNHLLPDTSSNYGLSEVDFLKKAQGCLPGSGGCLGQMTGCLSAIWKWLLWLFLFGFLIWLLRNCNDPQARKEVCDDAERLRIEAEQKKQQLDSLNKVLNTGLSEELCNISRLYFFENSTELTISSQGGVQLLSQYMKKHPQTGLEICGFSNNNPPEKIGIDQLRAQEIASLLKEGGNSESRIRIKWVGASGPLSDSTRQKDADGRYFNRNMRTEANLYLLSDGE